MLAITNILIIALVLLIAYWWANQGAFSSLLHLVCVVLAGAIAFGLWEPITVGFLLRGGGFDPIAWGVTLLGVFAVALFGLRLAFDRLIPANIDLPRWADLSVGGALGFASGVITIGIVVIGAGFIQSHQSIGGYSGYYINKKTGDINTEGSLWMPVHWWTNDFYALVSVGSLSTGAPLKQYNPQLHQQASFVRHSYNEGRGQISLPPDAARVTAAAVDSASNRCFVTMEFESGAMDFGEQLTIAREQVRLISDASGMSSPAVAFPDRWTAETGHHKWDDPTHFATSMPGQSQAVITFEFQLPRGRVPRFIQVKNTRFAMPSQLRQADAAMIAGLRTGGGGGSAVTITLDTSAPSVQGVLEVTNKVNPIVASLNSMPSGIEQQENLLTDGHAEFVASGNRPSPALRINGFYETPGTRMVQVSVERNGPADLFGRWGPQLEDSDEIYLVDDQGRGYPPLGYLLDTGAGRVEVKLAPGRFVRTVGELPHLPSSGSQKMRLLFSVTAGTTITGMQVGDTTIGTCAVPVDEFD